MFRLDAVVGPPARPIEIFDIGAMPEGEFRYASLLERGLARVTAFEPQAAERRRLEGLSPHLACRPEILGDGRAATFHLARYPGCSSLYAPDPAVIDAFCGIGASGLQGNFSVVATERVETVRLDDLPVSNPDFLKLDVQGAELTILQNGRNRLSHAVVVEAEVEFLPLYREQPLFPDVHAFMAAEGFAFHRFMNMAGRCWQPFSTDDPAVPVSQPLWADAVFVRDPCRLERWATDQLPLAAHVLHDLYGSYDLALRLLAEHDRRSGARTAAAYVAALRAEPAIPATFFSAAARPGTAH